MTQPSITKIRLKITYLKLHSNFPGAKELKEYHVYHGILRHRFVGCAAPCISLTAEQKSLNMYFWLFDSDRHVIDLIYSSNLNRFYVEANSYLSSSCPVPDTHTYIFIHICHYNDVIKTTMASQITSVAVVYSTVIQTQINENIKAPRHWPLCGEFTGNGEIPAQRASYGENVSIWWRHHVCMCVCVCVCMCDSNLAATLPMLKHLTGLRYP